MTEVKHTPGPWRACGGGGCSCKTVSCGDHPVAKVYVGEWGDDYPAIRLVGNSSLDMKAEAYMAQATYGSIPVDVATANSRLIAAAPDLLAALEAFMFADGHDAFTDEWPAARAAIAKAKMLIAE